MRKIIALLCILLFVSLPVGSAAEIVPEEDYEEQETGASVLVTARSYEPTILTSNLLEDNNVPVYIYLAGSTIGSLLQSSFNLEPVYGGIQIEKMMVKSQDIETSDFIVGEPKWYKPYKFDVDTLGYVVVTLKQFEPSMFEICESDEDCFEICESDEDCDSGYMCKTGACIPEQINLTFTADDSGYMCETGACIPKQINLTFTADIWFNEAERLYSLSKTALILPEDSNEDDWEGKLDQYGAQYSFFGGRGLVRVRDISENTVDLTVYSNKDMYWPIIGAPRAIEDVTLTKGETSKYIDLGYTDEEVLRNANFRITLNGIKDPADERANIAVTVGGKRMQLTVVEGSSLYPGSSWTVENIAESRGESGFEYVIRIKDAKGNTETITTTMAGGLSETELEVLGQTFSQDRSASTIYYETGEKVISKNTINNLGEIFSKWNVRIDLSEVSGDSTATNKVTIEDGMTMKDLLISILPSGYYYAVSENGAIAIKRYDLVDPCGEAVIYQPEALVDLVVEDYKYDSSKKLDMLCSAATQFRDIITNYDTEVMPDTGDNVVDAAKLKLAETYLGIAELDMMDDAEKTYCKLVALGYYKELVGSGVGDATNIQTSISNLQMQVYGDTTSGSVSIEDNEQSVYVELISVELNDEDSKSSVILSKDGVQSKYFVNKEIFGTSLEDKKYGNYNWVVYQISDNSVQLKKVYVKGASSTVKTIKLDESEVIEGYVIKVKEINSKKEAYLTITPGTGESLHSMSNFSVIIPIEKRAIQLNSEQIDDRIEIAKNMQEKLNKITENLDKIVKTWNYACLGVFSIIWLKNGLFSGGRNQVRSDVIHGFDGNGGWSDYCKGEATKQGTYDQCMQDNSKEIENDLKDAIKARDYVDDLKGNYDGEDWYTDIEKGYDGSLEECTTLLGDEVALDDDSLEDYAYMYKLNQIGSSSVMQNSLRESFAPVNFENPTDAEIKAKEAGCKDVQTALSSTANKAIIDKAKTAEEALTIKEQIASSTYESSYLMSKSTSTSKTGVEIPTAKYVTSLDNEYLENYEVILVGKVFEGSKSSEYLVYTITGNEKVSGLTYEVYLEILKREKLSLTNSDGSLKDPSKSKSLEKINADILRIEGDAKTAGFSGKEKADIIAADSGAEYYIASSTNKIYVGQAAYSSGSINEVYSKNAKLEVFNSGEYKGLPYCLPYKDGNFIKFISYTKNNEIDEIQFWNVGSDGFLCTNDDVLMAHQSELKYKISEPSYNKLVSFANKYVKMTFKEGQIIEIDDNNFAVSYGRSKADMGAAQASCYDVMSPSDCKWMFNTCDPVMCPPSRFNLGGRWNVDNVIETGMVGSLLLGQGNGDIVPVCLTGVLTSLKYWNSMLDGYVECLEAAKYEGKSVGICEKIKNVYICQLITEELVSILSSNKDGGLLDFIAQKVYNNKDNGGEYLNFKSNMQNMQDSISYFTTDYGATMFSAFKGRSMTEVGATICKQAIYGQLPWFGDFMDQITTPEDPNQFYATLTVVPYAPSQGLASYQTYYHIYAGNNENIPNVAYSVYLKNSISNEVFYTTDVCKGVSNSVELTDSVDQTVDCIAPEGLDTVCVVLNGETNCGFGSVTTSFSMDYLKDAIVADEATRNITTEEDCYPSSTVASPTVSSLASLGLTDSLILPQGYSLASTGIQRVCALENPGLGQGGSGDWIPVGSCGTDSAGRLLGSCWLNTESVNLKDANNVEKVKQYWEETSMAERARVEGIEMYSSEKSEEVYNQYTTTLTASNDCSTFRNYAVLYEQLRESTSSYAYSAASQYRIGEIFYEIGVGKVCGLKGSTDISYDAVFDDEATTKSEFTVSGRSMFSILFSGLGEDEEVSVTGSNKVECNGNGEVQCKTEIDIDDDEELTLEFTIDRKTTEDYSKTFRFVGEEVVATSTTESASDVCGGCGFLCGVEECNAISEGCYLDIAYLNSCEACSSLKSETPNDACGSISDSARCGEENCYSKFLKSGSCAWADDDKKCVYMTGVSASTTPSTTTITALTTSAYVTYNRKSISCEANAESEYYAALLDMIAWAEGANYNTLYGGGTFDDYSKHPNTKITAGGYISEAAGRYQFMYSTYSDLKKNHDLFLSFEPGEQDKAALYLVIVRRGVSEREIESAFNNGDFIEVFDKIAPEWASIPYSGTDCHDSGCGRGRSYYGQGNRDTEDLVEVFNLCYQNHIERVV